MPAISKHSKKNMNTKTKKIRKKSKKSKQNKTVKKQHLKKVVKEVVQEIVAKKKTRKASPKFDSVVTPVYKKFLLEAGVDEEMIEEALIKAEAELNPKFLLHARKPRAKKPSKAKKAKAPKKKALEDISEAKSAEDLSSNNVKSLKTWLKEQMPKIKLTALKKREDVIGAVMWKITGDGDEPTMVAPKPTKKKDEKKKPEKLEDINSVTKAEQLKPNTISELKAWLKENTKVKVSSLKNKTAMISAIMFVVTGEGEQPEFKKSKKKTEKKEQPVEEEAEEDSDEEAESESDEEEADEFDFN